MSHVESFDIIVIGAGAGGLNIATFMNRVGFRVLLVDRSDSHIGGDCLNFGCVPSKALLSVARSVSQGRHAKEYGFQFSGEVDWNAVKKSIVEKQSVFRNHESAEWFRSLGITVVLGEAKFASRDTVIVNNVVYRGRRIVIATGSRPKKLTVKGIELVKCVLNNENIFQSEYLPKRLLILGNGPIGVEIAQALQWLGSEVTLVGRGSQILEREDPKISNVLQERMELEGVKFLFRRRLLKFASGSEAVFLGDDGVKESVPFDGIFVAIGRELVLESLGLDLAGIDLGGDGNIRVNEYLQTTNSKVFLCGDVVGGPQFTHVAEMHAKLILRNFFSPIRKKFSLDLLSWVTYTNPEIATFGLSAEELTRRGIAYQVLEGDFSEDDRAITDGYRYGLYHLYVSPKRKILGGSMAAPNAGELIQEFLTLQELGDPIDVLFRKTYPYPSATRINKRISSVLFAEKLTPFVRRILRVLYS